MLRRKELEFQEGLGGVDRLLCKDFIEEIPIGCVGLEDDEERRPSDHSEIPHFIGSVAEMLKVEDALISEIDQYRRDICGDLVTDTPSRDPLEPLCFFDSAEARVKSIIARYPAAAS